MRTWHLQLGDPLAPIIAADARDGHTDPLNDQVWRLRLGEADEPAFTLETRYGGRVGLARVVPTWILGQRRARERRDYHVPPALTAFAPDTLRLEAQITPALQLTAELWAMTSRVVGGRFTVRNAQDAPQRLQLDLTAQVAREGQVLRRYLLRLEGGGVALHAAKLPRLHPVLMLRKGLHSPTARSHLRRALSVPPQGQVRFWWVLASEAERHESVRAAHHWLHQADWDAHFATLEAREHAAPQVETGDADWDAALAWAQQAALRAFVQSPHYPHPVLVSDRRPETVMLQGATLPEALHAAGTVALADAELAQGLVLNFLATYRDNGWVDVRPSLDGRPGVVLAPPRLGVMADLIQRFTDRDWASDTLEFVDMLFRRWANSQYNGDTDLDQDGAPEWSHPLQGAFTQGATLAQNSRWAQEIALETVEAPDLTAYGLAEARVLVPETIRRAPSSPTVQLEKVLAGFWDADHQAYRYRDRDAHTCPHGELIFDGRADQALEGAVTLSEPGRVLVHISGGRDHKPALRCTLEGTSWDGKPARETLSTERLRWHRGRGVMISRTVWAELSAFHCKGLSRVYHVCARAADLSRDDLALFVPLMVADKEHAAPLIARLRSPAYWREYGFPAVPADAPDYDPRGQNGPGGMWPEYAALLGEALVAHGERAFAVELFARVLRAQLRALCEEGDFRRFYNAESGEGLGALGSLQGATSWEWFTALFGAHVVNARTVQITGPFAFTGRVMTWRQHGVTVRRSAAETVITFADGKRVKLPPNKRGGIVRRAQR